MSFLTLFTPDTKHEEVDYLIQDILPRACITTTFAEPNVGKSRFWTQLVHHLAMGTGLFWDPLRPAKIAYISERSSKETWTQVRGLSINFNDVPNLALLAVGDLSRAARRTFNHDPLNFIDIAYKGFDHDMVVLDTMGRCLFSQGKAINFNDYGATTLAMGDLRSWATERNTVVGGVHHMRKRTKDNPDLDDALARSLGSQAIIGSSTCMWAMLNEATADESAYPRFMSLNIRTHLAPPLPVLWFKYNKNAPFELSNEDEARGVGIEIKDGKRVAPLRDIITEAIYRYPGGISRRQLLEVVLPSLDNKDPSAVYKVLRSLERSQQIKMPVDTGEVIVVPRPRVH